VVPQTIDFETLTLKDALDLAVLIEEEARDRYVELAGQMRMQHTAAAATFFERMTRVEEGHRTELLEKRRQLFGDAPSQVTHAMLADVEAPHVIDGRIELSLRQALEFALRAEEKAKDFFERALISVKSPDVRGFFSALREEEVEHRQWVLTELSLIAPELPHYEARPTA